MRVEVPGQSSWVSSAEADQTMQVSKATNVRLQIAERVLVALIVVELALLALVRSVNLDEGWYLWASKLVYEGQWLYHDFAYTQTPLLPYVYGLWQRLFGEGLYQGRVLTILLAIATWLISAASARRLGGQMAALGCLAVLATAFFAIGQYTYTATYALTAFLIAAALHMALSDRPEIQRTGLAASLFALAVCVRLSTVVALPIFLGYLIITSRTRWRALFWVLLASIITFGLVLIPFWLLDARLMLYDIFGFHTDRLLRVHWQWLRVRATIGVTLLDFAVPLLLGTGGALWAGWTLNHANGQQDKQRRTQAFTLIAILGMALGMFIAHLAPRTTDSYYNALQMPLMSVAGGVVLARCFSYLRTQHSASVAYAFVFCVIVANGWLQAQALIRERLVAVPLQNQIATVRSAARLLQRHTQPGDPLLSFNPHLALEAGLRTPHGYEMSIFAYRPTWTSEEAVSHKVVNNERLIVELGKGKTVAAFSEFDLEMIYGERDGFFQALDERYRWAYTVPRFGPYGDALHIYLLPEFTPPAPQVERKILFEDSFTLVGYDLTQQRYGTETTLDLGIYWQAAQTPSQPYTVFVQLLDEAGRFVTGADSPPCHNTCPTTTWRPGEFVRDEHTLSLTGLSSATTYQLQIGMYDGRGQRLKLVADGINPAGDSVVLTTVTVP